MSEADEHPTEVIDPQPDDVTRAERHALNAAQHVDTELRRRPTRRQVRATASGYATVISVVGAVIAIVVSGFAAHDAASVRVEQAAQNASAQSNRDLAQKAYDSARQANDRLAQRGQTPVPVPAPDQSDPSDTIAAAAAAIVLANQPPARMPTTAQVAKGVADYMATHPIAPASPGDVFAAVATYLAQNPPQAGPQGTAGEKGDKGDPPTEEAIQTAFLDYVNAHPEWLPLMLCQGRGQFDQAQDLVLADGGRVSGYLCITSRTDPPPVTTTTDTTTTTENGGGNEGGGGLLPIPTP